MKISVSLSLSALEILSKHVSPPQFDSHTPNQSLNKNFRQHTACSADSQIEYGPNVNDNEEVYNQYSSNNQNVHVNDVSGKSPVNNITIASSISYGQSSSPLVTINDSQDNRSNTLQSHTSTSKLKLFYSS